MPSEQIKNPKRIVVLVETTDGMQHGWEVFPPMVAEWVWTGSGPQGATGRISASGVFHRMKKDQRSREIEAAMVDAKVISEPEARRALMEGFEE